MIQSPCSKFDSPFWAMVWCEMIAAVEHVQLYTMWKEKLAWDMVWFIYDLSGLYQGLTLEISGSENTLRRNFPARVLVFLCGSSVRRAEKKIDETRKVGRDENSKSFHENWKACTQRTQQVFERKSEEESENGSGKSINQRWGTFFRVFYSSFAFPARNCVMANRIFCALLSLT